MAFSSPLGDEQTLRDLLVGHARGDHHRHLALAPAEQAAIRQALVYRSGSAEGIVEHFGIGHPLAFLRRRLAPVLVAEAGAGLARRGFQLTCPERPHRKRVLARQPIRGGGEAQRSIVLAACGSDQSQADQAPDDPEPIIDDPKDCERLAPRLCGQIDIAVIQLRVGEAL